MNYEDLTPEEKTLVNLDFGDELQKQASAYVDSLEEDSEEAVKTAQACAEMGSELAVKIAQELEEKYKEKKEDKEEKKDEKPKTEEEKKEEVVMKEAAVRGAILFENTISALEKLGEERFGDKSIYIEELVKESGKMEAAQNLMKAIGSHFKSVGSKAVAGAKQTAEGAKSYARGMKQQIGKKYPGSAPASTIAKKQGKENLKAGLKNLAPAAAYGGGTLAAGYGFNKLRK